MYVVLKVCIIYFIYFVGDWSNGMIGVSKTFGGSSILSSPALEKVAEILENTSILAIFCYRDKNMLQSV